SDIGPPPWPTASVAPRDRVAPGRRARRGRAGAVRAIAAYHRVGGDRMIDRRGMLVAMATAMASPAAAARQRRRDLDGVWTAGSYTDLQRPRTLPRLVT